MNISDQSETYGHNVSHEVGTVDSFNNVRNSVPLKSIEKQTNTTTECQKNYSVNETEKKQAHVTDMSLQNEYQKCQELHRPVVSRSRINAEAVPFEPSVSSTAFYRARFMEVVEASADTCFLRRQEKLLKLEGSFPRLHRFCTSNGRIQATVASAVPLW